MGGRDARGRGRAAVSSAAGRGDAGSDDEMVDVIEDSDGEAQLAAKRPKMGAPLFGLGSAVGPRMPARLRYARAGG